MKFISHVLLMCSMIALVSCGDENQLQSQDSAAPETRSEVNDLSLKSQLTRIEKPHKDVIVVPWEATTQGRLISFKTHKINNEDKSLTVSVINPNKNWFDRAPPYVFEDRLTFKYRKDQSDGTKDVFVYEIKERTKMDRMLGSYLIQLTADPYKFEIALYKNLDGAYTTECDYSVEFQRPNFWGTLKPIADHAIHHSCPITRM